MAKKVLVMMGGFSSEREVSLVSGKGCAEALSNAGYEVIAYDLKDVEDFVAVLLKEKPDVVFNALHGTFGEDGTVQGFLDMMQIPYTHSGLQASCVGMNKVLTKELCEKYGINVAKHQVVSAKKLCEMAMNMDFPFVAKPISEGSSVGVFVVKNKKDAAKIKYDNNDMKIMVEPFIDGQELTVMVLKNKAYVVTELRPKVDFYDYKAKYTSGITEHIIPANVSDDVAKTCMEYAVKAHKALGCNTVSRSDFRYNPKDGVVFLEINTHPGMTPLSLVPEQAKYVGISYEKLCSTLVENASCKKV